MKNSYFRACASFALCLLGPLLFAGCLVEAGAEGEADGDVGEVDEAVRRGSEALEYGVVRIRFPSGSSCTGAMIGPHHIVTAASCLYGRIGFSGRFDATIYYFDPEDEKRRITKDDEDEDLFGFVNEGYMSGQGVHRSDPESDLALIVRDGGGSSLKTWRGTNSEDYLRISLGNCSQIEKTDFFGQGADNFKGQHAGTLRTMGIELSECHKHYLVSKGGSKQTCNGDEGGPYIVKWDGSRRAIAGLHAWEGGTCTSGGEQQLAMRFNDDKVAWIEDKAGAICHEYTEADHRYVRCW